MNKVKNAFKNFFKSLTLYNYLHMGIGLAAVAVVAIIFHGEVFAVLMAIFGIVAANINARGNIVGAFLSVLLSVFYSVVAIRNAYFGEVIVYLALYIPLNIAAIVSWLKNRSENKMLVKINTIHWKEWLIVAAVACALAIGGFFFLRAFNTTNLWLSTASMVTAVLASYCIQRRDIANFYFYGINSIIFIAMWLITIISTHNLTLLPMLVATLANFIGDFYGVYNWTKLKKQQKLEVSAEHVASVEEVVTETEEEK